MCAKVEALVAKCTANCVAIRWEVMVRYPTCWRALPLTRVTTGCSSQVAVSFLNALVQYKEGNTDGAREWGLKVCAAFQDAPVGRTLTLPSYSTASIVTRVFRIGEHDAVARPLLDFLASQSRVRAELPATQ